MSNIQETLKLLKNKPNLYNEYLAKQLQEAQSGSGFPPGGGGGGGTDLSEVAAASGNWNSTYTTVYNNSALWINGTDLTDIISVSGNWNSSYTTVNSNSANWDSTHTTVGSNSANWDSTYNTVYSTSAEWSSAYSVTVGGEYLPIDSVIVGYNPNNYSINTADVSGHLEGVDTQFGYLSGKITTLDTLSGTIDNKFVHVSGDTINGQLIISSVGDTLQVYTDEAGNFTNIGKFSIYNTNARAPQMRLENPNATQPSYSFYGDSNTGMWGEGSDVLSFSTSGVNRVTIDTDSINLSGNLFTQLTGNNSIVTTTSAGLLQNSTATITEGASGGSILNFVEFASDPDTSELITGDIWVSDNPSNGKKALRYYSDIVYDLTPDISLIESASASWNDAASGNFTGITLSAQDIELTSATLTGGSPTSTGLYLTLNINGSALYLPIYK